MERIRFGFKSKTQLPLFMVWREYFDETGKVYFAKVLYNSMYSNHIHETLAAIGFLLIAVGVPLFMWVVL